jgi:hypothetical protein
MKPTQNVASPPAAQTSSLVFGGAYTPTSNLTSPANTTIDNVDYLHAETPKTP